MILCEQCGQAGADDMGEGVFRGHHRGGITSTTCTAWAAGMLTACEVPAGPGLRGVDPWGDLWVRPGSQLPAGCCVPVRDNLQRGCPPLPLHYHALCVSFLLREACTPALASSPCESVCNFHLCLLQAGFKQVICVCQACCS